MKKNLKFLAMAVVSMAAAVFTGCSSDDDFLASYEESAIQTRATPNPDGSYLSSTYKCNFLGADNKQ